MPIYKVTITKQMDDGPAALHQWHNVYHINATDNASVVLRAPTLVDLEKTLYPDNAAIIRWSVSDQIRGGFRQSSEVFVGGTRSVGAVATQLPLWNVMLCKFTFPTGRPSLKYLRLVLDESEVSSGNITAAVINAVETGYSNPLVALGYVCNVRGVAVAAATPQTRVQERQLGWHRRHRAGFHRGWVAN